MIIVADLTPFEIGDNFDLKAEGTLSIDLVFKSPLAAAINILVYAEYDNIIEIDSNLNVIGATSDEHLSVTSSPYERSVY